MLQNDTLSKYCDLLQCTLNEYGLLNKPTHIYNLDELGMPLDPKPCHVVTKSGKKHPSTVVTGDKTQITVLGCCSASGHCLPPFVVFKRKSLTQELCKNEISGTSYGLS